MPPSPSFIYDVFISYSHRDEVWVEKTLLPRLEAAGLKVCIDFRDFMVGKPALYNMEDAIKTSRHTLLVLTEDWVASEWANFEAILVRTADPAGLQRRTIPLRLKPCQPADAIAMLTWVDFTRPEREALAWRQLLIGLGVPSAQSTPTAATAPSSLPVPPSRSVTPSPEAIRQLRSALATLYPDRDSATRIAEDAGLPVVSIRLSDRAIDNWHAIIKEAQKHNRLTRLLEIAHADYPRNDALNAAMQGL